MYSDQAIHQLKGILEISLCSEKKQGNYVQIPHDTIDPI
jgi:hypothetical protein